MATAIGATENELPLPNVMSQFDTGDRDGGIGE